MAIPNPLPMLLALSLRLSSPLTVRPDGVELPALPWQQRSDWINVKERCGAVGDGLTDDTAAINNCLALAPSGPWFSSVAGPTIYFPPGAYRLTDTLVAGTRNMSAAPPSSQGWLGGGLVGHGRDTQLIWDGLAGGQINGTSVVQKRLSSPALYSIFHCFELYLGLFWGAGMTLL